MSVDPEKGRAPRSDVQAGNYKAQKNKKMLLLSWFAERHERERGL